MDHAILVAWKVRLKVFFQRHGRKYRQKIWFDRFFTNICEEFVLCVQIHNDVTEFLEISNHLALCICVIVVKKQLSGERRINLSVLLIHEFS